MLGEVPETSGLAIGRRRPGLLWTHNDSGHDTVLFAVNAAGAVLGRVRVPVQTRDWEDVSAGPCPAGECLYVGDIGDNGRARGAIHVYRVPEPAPGDARTAPPDEFTLAYPDGAHNAEAMLVAGADLFIIARDREGGVYRATLADRRELGLRRIGQLGLSAVTDAETSRDGRLVVVRTSHEAVLYRTADFVIGEFLPYVRIPLDGLKESQGEGVALDGDTLYLSSEGRPWNPAGRLLRLRCQFAG